MNTSKRIPILVAAAMILIIVIGAISLSATSPSRKLRKQLELGQKYLNELSYEQAVAAFDKAIDIDPMSVDAYLGLADAYIGLGDTDKAKEALQKGYDLTGDERLMAKLKSLEASTTASQEENPPAEEPVLSGPDKIRAEFADLLPLLDDYGYNRFGESRGSGDWREVFLPLDEVRKTFEPMITGLEDYLKFKEENGISDEDEREVFGTLVIYELKDMYIMTHDFEKAAKLPVYKNMPSSSKMKYDEYNRLIYQEQSDGSNTTYVWGDNGFVTTYTAVLMPGEARPEGSTEVCTFEYDDSGRITLEHIDSTIPGNGKYSSDLVYTYEGDICTCTSMAHGQVGNVIKYKISKYGYGIEIE